MSKATNKDPFADLVPSEGKSYGTGTSGTSSSIRGFVGPFSLIHEWMVMTDTDIRKDESLPTPNLVVETTTGRFMNYFLDDEEAEVVKVATDTAYVNHYIGGTCQDASQVLNLHNPENWTNGVTQRTQVVSMGTKDWSKVAAYQLIFLPSFVQAVALTRAKVGVAGWPSERIFSLDAIRDLSYAQYVGEREAAENQTAFFGAFTDEAQKNLVGTGKADYAESALWKMRADLWAALGEPDPTKTAVHIDGPKRAYMTDAPLLSQAISLMTKSWVKPMWANFEFIDNPVTDAVSKTTGKRFTCPAFVEFFLSQEEAKAALPETEASDVLTSDGRKLPAAWADIGESDWYVALDAIRNEYAPNFADLTKPQVKEVTKKYIVTEQELADWLK